MDDVARAVIGLIPLILSLTVHEYAHAFSALKLGDDTASREGRVTLNPIVHMDPIGTLALPLMLGLFGGGIMFGWAKPVPFNPLRFTRKVSMRAGVVIVAAAGPLSNLGIAFLSACVFSFLLHSDPGSAAKGGPLWDLLGMMFGINVALFVFNMIPIYPLDGQKVLSGFLPGETAVRFEQFSYRYGSWLLLLVIFAGSRLLAYPFALVRDGILAVVGLG